jgi:hypothetical protein
MPKPISAEKRSNGKQKFASNARAGCQSIGSVAKIKSLNDESKSNPSFWSGMVYRAGYIKKVRFWMGLCLIQSKSERYFIYKVKSITVS